MTPDSASRRAGGRPEAPPQARLEPAPTLSVVVAALDEAAALPALWARLEPVLDALGADGVTSEVVLVNDGSTDDTLAMMRALCARSGRVRVVDLARRFGHQAALAAGLAHARGAAVAVLDADLQDPPELLAEMVRRWREGFEVVYGVRRRRDGDGAFKRGSAALFYRLLGLVAGETVRSGVGDFALMDRRVVEALAARRDTRPFLRGALAEAGFRHTGVSYDRGARVAGETKYPLRRMVALAADAVTSLSIAPLRVATALGLLGLLGGLVGLVATGGGLGPLVITMGGVQLLSVGVLGEYLGRVHEIVSRRPLYLVREVFEGEEEEG